MFTYIETEKDLFSTMIQCLYNKNKKKMFYKVNDENNLISNSIAYPAFKLINNTINSVNFVNDIYTIHEITGSYEHEYNILKYKSIFHILNKFKLDSIYDKHVYEISNKININTYLKDIFNIYKGIINKNCYIIFTFNNRKFCLSKSFFPLCYKKNEKGKLCLFINNEYWEY